MSGLASCQARSFAASSSLTLLVLAVIGFFLCSSRNFRVLIAFLKPRGFRKLRA